MTKEFPPGIAAIARMIAAVNRKNGVFSGRPWKLVRGSWRAPPPSGAKGTEVSHLGS